jgi:hypothetical protein
MAKIVRQKKILSKVKNDRYWDCQIQDGNAQYRAFLDEASVKEIEFKEKLRNVLPEALFGDKAFKELEKELEDLLQAKYEAGCDSTEESC